jgi:putative Holliday junction resolvase
MRVLGIDYGSARIGVALGDTETRLASPWRVIEARSEEETLSQLRDLIAQEKIEKIVVGVPRPFADREIENEQVRDIRAFIAALQVLGVAIEEEDEALSSRLAARQVQSAGEKGKRDDLAAANILQTWLDRNAVHP